ncbi:uncharacterized protein LOC127279520 [Leptopilina boulardi]|uniref:uncharacterized protein LOC127279520 n=1 Tax=Leptopilina boulardi TaxID=63433 RepID=UPI0021F520BC|nr:uncharacterized protein LOC127279520 [Leptopilina boulardi]
MISYMLFTLIPVILDTVMPLNETRSPRLAIELDYYFFDKHDYYLWTTIHLCITAMYGVVSVISTDILLFTFTLHACGMFKVLRYKLKVIMIQEDTAKLLINTSVMYRKAASCVEIHNRILMFVN